MPRLDLDAFKDAEERKKDKLKLALKEEKKVKPPMPFYKIALILFGIMLVIYGASLGLARVIQVHSNSSNDFYYWSTILLMIDGGLALFIGGIFGVWGGQRTIPIRIIAPSDATVVGKGLFITGYVIEQCMDNEIEITIYDKDNEVLFNRLLSLTKEGLFYIKLEDFLVEEKKTKQIVIEAWMVSLQSRKLLFAVKKKTYDELNIKRKGLKIGAVVFFPVIYRDFTDKVKIIFDPKRKEKGVIEKVKLDKHTSINIFFPGQEDEPQLVPFSFERLAEMRTNALYFDIRRRRRLWYSLVFFIMTLLFFLPPLIFVFL
ncbi:MAG: hypothetical protein ACTSXO_02295 [Candidatus Heimdallarchaeota archaeon]|nr:MAG: hypothetical protein DRO63_02250 [Candidatus Gerdarchaeota archaeon]RLI71120.1 MAG: hypothetical protein DRP02_05725 [Candidatus Gerdarchaeota archaeon]RLI72122.1 MAG: hypothetical protein DRO91_04825 [Candidatus Heimdallarchaeota archaeon]